MFTFWKMKPYSISPRQTIRIVQGLEKEDWIKKARIKGKRKLKGYTINENPYNPRFGTTIEYLVGSILPALKSIEKALENP